MPVKDCPKPINHNPYPRLVGDNFEPKPVSDAEFGESIPEKIFFKGEVFRFKPQLDRHFLARYIVITDRELRYYKREFDIIVDKPILRIPAQNLMGVRRISEEDLQNEFNINQNIKMRQL